MAEEFARRTVWLPWLVLFGKVVSFNLVTVGVLSLVRLVSESTYTALWWPVFCLPLVYIAVATVRMPRTWFVARVWFADGTWHAIDTWDPTLTGDGATQEEAVDRVAYLVAMKAIHRRG